MGEGKSQAGTSVPQNWKRRWVERRNRIIASKRFQNWASRIWPLAPVARHRATRVFDLVAGFTYSQVLLACVESGLLDLLEKGAADADSIALKTNLPRDAALRLVRAAEALDLAEQIAPGWWMLGQQGAALQTNEGAKAMVRHHKLLYRDIADPLALLRADRKEPTQLSSFWKYAETGSESEAGEYSTLMAVSQEMVSEQVLAAYDFGKHDKVLDVGGGHGRFVSALANAHPDLQLAIFDLPPVVEGTAARMESGGLPNGIALHPGDFFAGELPQGFDCISLVRILHDHDDAEALTILRAIHRALPANGRLVLAEPMAETPGAAAMGDAYFGMYLWAMNAGRPRSEAEIGELLTEAGFGGWKKRRTHQPIITSVIVSFL